MQTIFDQSFQNEELPSGWYTDTPFPKYEGGFWDCRKGDGAIVPLPHDSWQVLRLEIELAEVGPDATAFCGTDSRTALSLAPGDHSPIRHTASDGGYTICWSDTPIACENGAVSLVFEWTDATMRVLAGGKEVLVAPNLRQSARAGSFQLGFRDCIVRRMVAFGHVGESIPASIHAIQDDFLLEVTVDFNDDLIPCAWTHRTFEALFRELKSWGTKRVAWIDLGREADAYFDHAPYGTGPHGLETFRNVGDIFTAAVDHAHQSGMELYGVLKPYDMAIAGHTWPPFSKDATEKGRIHRIGGASGWSTRMAAENQHLLMARKPGAYGPALNEVWTRLDLVKDDAQPAAFSPDDVVFLVSDDNETFRPYDGPISREEVVEEYPAYRLTPSGPQPTGEVRRTRIFRFRNLEIRAPFFAIEVEGSGRSFSNRFCDLVHLFGEHGEETRVTYAMSPRRREADVCEVGFEFNRFHGTPSNLQISGAEPMNTPLALDRGAKSYLAFARGKDRSPLALMSPNFPETRKLWLGWVEAMLDSGADGIDIRSGHHHCDFLWLEYGFEEPVREAMLKRTGVDIWATDDFDHEEWRKIRGEGWTQFVREASQLVRSRGKKIVAHMDSLFDNPPGLGASMNLVVDWRSWLTEKLLDGVTGKALWPASSLALEVLALAHANRIPVAYVPYSNNFFEDRASMNHIGGSPGGCQIPVERLIAWGRESGFDSFGFYECASALRASEDGIVNFRPNAAPLRAVMQNHFANGENSPGGEPSPV